MAPYRCAEIEHSLTTIDWLMGGVVVGVLTLVLAVVLYYKGSEAQAA